MYSSNLKGFILAVVCSAVIGSSFIIKKKGLRRRHVGGYGYMLKPFWWVGMITMIVGELANFVAYIYAPAVPVTPLGALSIIVRDWCVLCIVGSTIIMLHAPQEQSIDSVIEIWNLAIQPDLYTPFSPKVSWYIQGNGEVWKQKHEDGSSPRFVTIPRQDYFK